MVFVSWYIFELVTCIHIQIFLSLICTVSLSVPNIFCPLVSGKLFSPCRIIVQLFFAHNYPTVKKNSRYLNSLDVQGLAKKMDQIRVQSISLFSSLTVAFNKDTNSKKKTVNPHGFSTLFLFLHRNLKILVCFMAKQFFFRLKISIGPNLGFCFFWLLAYSSQILKKKEKKAKLVFANIYNSKYTNFWFYVKNLIMDLCLLHSWVLGIDNLAKWQKNMLQLKRFGGFMAINLQILNTQIIQKHAIFHSHKKEVCSLRCAKMHKPKKT